MKHSYILSLDQGTTGSSAALFRSEDFSLVATSKVEFPQYYPQSGWVEHDAEEIWQSVVRAIAKTFHQAKRAEHRFDPRLIVSIGITNQRETVVPIDRKTAKPLARAIVWQDRRTAERCSVLSSKKAVANNIRHWTGLVCDPYFSATKIEWFLRNNNLVQKALQNKTLGFCTMDSYLIFKLTGDSIFVTDHSNASRTMLYDLHLGDYREELLNLFGIPRHTLPSIVSSAGGFGVTQGIKELPSGIPITGVLGDQQAALFAHGGTERGIGKITYGTGAFLLVNTGKKIPTLPKGLLGTVAYDINGNRSFAVEGSAFIAGAAVQFLRDNFSWIKHSSDVEALAKKDSRDERVAFVPSLAGLGAPYWNPTARGAILGLSRGTSRSQITRAVLESIALQNVSLVKLMNKAAGGALKKLGVDGGVAKSDYVMQFQSDILRLPLYRGAHTEMTALGAAMIAYQGLTGKSPHRKALQKVTTFSPRMSLGQVNKLVQYWEHAVTLVDSFS